MNRLKTKKYILLVTAASLTAALLLSSCGGSAPETVISANSEPEETGEGSVFDESKSQPAGSKEEMVSIKADASGKPLEVTSSVTLSDIGEGEFVMDSSNLENIRNTEGDEEYELKDTQLLWKNKGEDILYEGDSTALPDVGVEITYYLDGKQLSPEEIAGKSGDVKLHFQYTNNVKEQVDIDGSVQEIHVPYVFLTMILLDGEHFKDIEVKNGTLSSMDDMELIAGYAVPGLKRDLGLSRLEIGNDLELPEYVEVTAKATDFALDFTTTIVSSGLFEDLEVDKIQDGKDLVSSMKELKSASSKILSGLSSLSDGAGQFDSALKTYTDGASQLTNGAQQLADGAVELNNNGAALKDGATQISDGLTAINSSLDGFDLSSLGEGLTESNSLLAGEEGALNDVATLKSKLETIQEQLSEEDYAQLMTQIGIIEGKVNGASQILSAMDTNTLQEQFQNLMTSIGVLADGSAQLKEGVTEYIDGVSQLAQGTIALQEGSAALSSGGSELYNGYGKLKEGITQLKDGYAVFDSEAIGELGNLAGDSLNSVLNRLETIQKIDKESRSFSGEADGTKASVQYIIETEKVEKQNN